MFYVIATLNLEGEEEGRIIDFTSWVDVPPPEYVTLTSPNPIVVRQGETKDITAQLKSSAGFIPQVIKFTPVQNHSSIFVSVKNGDKRHGTEPIPLMLNVPVAAQIGSYTIPILANISTGATFPSSFSSVKVASLLPSQDYRIAKANLTVSIAEQLTFPEWFKEVWNTYKDLITLIGGGFAAGFSALTIDKIKERFKSKKKTTITWDY